MEEGDEVVHRNVKRTITQRWKKEKDRWVMGSEYVIDPFLRSFLPTQSVHLLYPSFLAKIHVYSRNVLIFRHAVRNKYVASSGKQGLFAGARRPDKSATTTASSRQQQ